MAYKDRAVVGALQKSFHGKCAYCEIKYAGGAPADVDHYRPKGGVLLPDLTLRRPGYYWLAADWDNLLPSCIDCNRARTQKFDDLPPQLSGKANKFPIADEATRAVSPGEEVNEEPLILHPYLDDPAAFLEFEGNGVVRVALDEAGQELLKGSTTRDTLGLNRRDLVQTREERAIEINAWVKRLEIIVEHLSETEHQNDGRLQDDLAEAIQALRRYIDPALPFSGMAKQLVEPAIARATE
jgi:uncharacterized protein (TIGR02646 family)